MHQEILLNTTSWKFHKFFHVENSNSSTVFVVCCDEIDKIFFFFIFYMSSLLYIEVGPL